MPCKQRRYHLRGFMAVLASLVLAGCSVFGDRSGTEQVGFEVVETLSDSVEIRDYGSRVVAETEVPAKASSPSSTAFQRLFDYIQGANKTQAKISMTAPVETEQASSEKIAMTAPVETETVNDVFRMAFFLPASMTLETAPVPTDPEVSLRSVPSRFEAVKRFSGSRSDQSVMEQTEQLSAIVEANDWAVMGPPRTYFYDPPWTLPWARRNEVAIPVTRGS